MEKGHRNDIPRQEARTRLSETELRVVRESATDLEMRQRCVGVEECQIAVVGEV